MREGFVVVAHGSSDPHAASALGELVPLVAHRAKERGLSVPDLRIAYLGHAAPSVPQVMRAFGPDMRVRVLPLLLTAAYHSKTDLPRVLARTGVPVRYGNPLGPHPLLLRALEPAANATIARLAAGWQAAAGWFAVRPAYASAAGPTPAQAVTELRIAGARRVVVASYLLAPGLFADRIRDASLAAGADAVSPPLLPWPPATAGDAASVVADVLLVRYIEAGSRERTAA